MSRYLASDCESLKAQYLKRITTALTSIENNYKNMDFKNANEKDVTMQDDLDKIKKQLKDAQDKLNSMTFE